MALRTIVKEGTDILRMKSRPVVKFDERLWCLIDDMIETLHKADGAGLAAPQVGVLRRVVVIDIGEGVIELVNPRIVMKSGEQREAEGCLSCPGEYGIVVRPMNVTVKAQDRNGNDITVSGSGLLAKAFCHELDHLEGILFKDKAIEMLEPAE